MPSLPLHRPPPTRQPLGEALRGLVNAAGGLLYHFTAWRFRKTLWRSYSEQAAKLLAEWSPDESALVIVGPSAGWNLPAAFLQRFDRVTAIEPDPLARLLLRLRFPHVQWQMDTTDYFTPHGTQLWTENLARLFARYPNEALLFSEFFSQLLGLYPEAIVEERDGGVLETAAFARWKTQLRSHLAKRSYFSAHDRWVSSTAPRPLPPLPLPFDVDGPPPLELWPAPQQAFDPFTAAMTPDVPQRVVVWQRLPDRWHAMAVVWRKSGAAPTDPDAIRLPN